MVKEKTPTPVFVFLDENIAQMDEKIAEYFAKNLPDEVEKFDFIFFPFPTKNSNKSKNKTKGKTDYEVVCFVKKLIFSDERVENRLYQSPSPQFVFLTRDQDFLKDVVKEMRKDNKQIGGIIMPAENIILLIERETTVPLSIVCVYHKPNIRKKAMVAAISKTLKDFLGNNF